MMARNIFHVFWPLFLLVQVKSGDCAGVYSLCDEIVCEAGYTCHPTKFTCSKDPPKQDRPAVFLGCDRRPSDCAIFDFTYVGSYDHNHDASEWCAEPDNILCVSQVAPPLPAPTSADTLHVAAYNTWERPFWMTLDGQRERTCRIPRQMASHWPNIDVITFQESFMGGCWPKQASMRDLMVQHGFKYFTKTVSAINILNGGIWLASKWPILEEDQFVYQNPDLFSWDFFASKGVIYAKIEKTVDDVTRVYHVMGTHCQAGNAPRHHHIRIGQMAEWRAFLDSKNIPKNEGVFFSGDFNIHSQVTPDILANATTILGAVVPPLLEGSWGGGDAEYARNQIDYVMYSSEHRQPKTATQKFVRPVGDKEFDVCWCSICPWLRSYVYPNDPNCKNVKKRTSLSDHNCIYGEFTF